jgi:hypothetical protein
VGRNLPDSFEYLGYEEHFQPVVVYLPGHSRVRRNLRVDLSKVSEAGLEAEDDNSDLAAEAHIAELTYDQVAGHEHHIPSADLHIDRRDSLKDLSDVDMLHELEQRPALD